MSRYVQLPDTTPFQLFHRTRSSWAEIHRGGGFGYWDGPMGPDMSAFGLDREGRKDKTTETVIMRQSGSSQQRSPRNETADVLD